MDLDWDGCSQKVGHVFGPSCEEIKGCSTQRLWLDTPRQSCRFTDAHKLYPDNVPRFLPVELARLEEKTGTFSKGGCLFGGWWSKCYRRMRQIIRLLKYVRRAVDEAKKDPSHPAHALATSPDTRRRLHATADNLAEGFRKHESASSSAGKKGGFEEAFHMLQGMPDMLRSSAEAAKRAENRSLTDAEMGALENTVAVEALLKVVDTDLTEEQRSELYAQVEGGGDLEESEDELDGDVEELVGSLDEAMDEADDEDRGNLQQQEGHLDDDEEDPEDEVARIAEGGSLAQLGSATNSTGAVQSRGTGPLKWLFQHGLGWIVKRVAWLLLFLVGAAVGLLRAAVIFPLLFVSCTLTKFFVWLFRDVGYNLLWEGESDKAVSRFKKIGKCAPWMWEAVGFDASAPSAGEVAGQIVVQPAAFASGLTGVHHWYKSEEAMCSKVRCGSNARCKAGLCICNKGFYPDKQDPDLCSPAPTASGCACKPYWTEPELLIFTKKHYGCPLSGKCEVDTNHASFQTCQGAVQGPVGQWLFGSMSVKEKCTRGPFRGVVQALNITSA